MVRKTENAYENELLDLRKMTGNFLTESSPNSKIATHSKDVVKILKNIVIGFFLNIHVTVLPLLLKELV